MLLDLLNHCEWADATLWRAVLAHSGSVAIDDVDETIVGWLHHIHLVQGAFASVWADEVLDLKRLPEPSDHADLHAIAGWGRANHRRLQEYLAGCDESEMEREVVFPWAARLATAAWGQPPQPVTLRESAHQVAMHSVHHRAQVASRLRQLGGEPPPIDYIIWLWRGRPATEWPGSGEPA